jgi:L-ascorbate metabolism protein UlaG (beta-lactamase superfamily)
LFPRFASIIFEKFVFRGFGIVKIRWLGHSCFLIAGKDKILVDPFLSGNENAPVAPGDVECDIICVTHGHGDHIGDAVEIGKRTGAPIVAIYEIATYVGQWTESFGMNKGGSTKLKNSRITLVDAKHSSGITGSEFKHSGGEAAGFVFDSGKVIYHAGDTALFSDMKLFGELYKPEIALLPIGDLYTMGPEEAAKAVKLLGCKKVIPMHYNTWPQIQQDPEKFKKMVEKSTKATVLVPGLGKEIEI